MYESVSADTRTKNPVMITISLVEDNSSKCNLDLAKYDKSVV